MGKLWQNNTEKKEVLTSVIMYRKTVKNLIFLFRLRVALEWIYYTRKVNNRWIKIGKKKEEAKKHCLPRVNNYRITILWWFLSIS